LLHERTRWIGWWFKAGKSGPVDDVARSMMKHVILFHYSKIYASAIISIFHPNTIK
jgi:hypothetical protein